MGRNLSPCGNYRIIEATVGGASQVLADLSRVEQEERDRLGIDNNEAVFQSVNEGRCWQLIQSRSPNKVLAVFGVSEHVIPLGEADAAVPARYVWFLPTQYLVDNRTRDLADPHKVQWVLEFIWSSIPTDYNKQPVVLFNGATVENKTVLRWIKKVVGARMGDKEYPAGPKQVPTRPFFLLHSPSYV